ncbi:MAG TPA: hypothetical protein VGY55_15295 [Pirellulales bacterium]|jgi:hypothetical protein|nr:hypothetical protein [Pirellulales bacterium]
MTWFTEDSTPILVIGVIVEAILLLALVKTSRVGLLYAIVGVGIVTGAIVWIEKHTDTDTKRIRRVLDAAAVAVEKNDMPGLLALISPAAQGMRSQVSGVLPQVEIRKAYVTGLAVKVNRFNNPPTATAEFFGQADGKDRHGVYADQHYIARFKVNLHFENDRWLMDDYEEQPGLGNGG